MSTLKETIKNIKKVTRGAACFFDPALNATFCENNLTENEALEVAQKMGLTLKRWTAGKSCSQVSC